LGNPTGVCIPFAYRALTCCGATFQNASTRQQICNSVEGLAPLLSVPTTPTWQRHQALPPARFGLIPFRSPLLRESLLLSSPRGTEMFQFPRFPLPALCVQTGVTPHDGRRVSPFGYPRIEAWSAAPRGFSQPPTSFIGFRRQGIHRWLFVAWKTKMLVLAMEFSRGTTGGAKALRPSKQPAAGQGRRELFSEGGHFTPSKRNRGSPGAWLDPTPEVLVSKETIAYDGGRRGRRQASDQLGVPLTDVRGSNSLERR
jgi:hypothetical protein